MDKRKLKRNTITRSSHTGKDPSGAKNDLLTEGDPSNVNSNELCMHTEYSDDGETSVKRHKGDNVTTDQSSPKCQKENVMAVVEDRPGLLIESDMSEDMMLSSDDESPGDHTTTYTEDKVTKSTGRVTEANEDILDAYFISHNTRGVPQTELYLA